ncbi:hypothetical protein GCM10009839_02960 [Catenulispora yoronensis]|uniref:Uncharacterized protein n=2 Tax=Catenulispora yoronensis TaxID=450799 RepID=A0ABN2TKI9_9ACTN
MAAPVSFPAATGACKLVTPQEIQQTVGVRLISMEQHTFGNEDKCVYGVTKQGTMTLGVEVIRKSGGVAIVNDQYGKFVDFPGHKAVWYGAMLYIAVGNDALEVDLTGANGHQSETIAAAVAQTALSRM